MEFKLPVNSKLLMVVFFTALSMSVEVVPPPLAIYPLNKEFTTEDLQRRLAIKGIASNTLFTRGPNNERNGAYQFSGNANSYIEFPNGGGILDAKNSFTFMCWVRPGGKDGPLFNYGKRAWGVHIWLVGGGKFFMRITKYNSHEDYDHVLTDRPLEVGKWVHVAATYNFNTGVNSVYIDGVLKKKKKIGTGSRISTNDAKVRMGVKEGDGRYFNGAIAHVGVWNVSLTPEQILSVRNKSKPIVVKCQNLTVSHLVKTLPNSCVTSEMKINTSCSFSCPHGYKLQGPSYKQCGSRGQWTDKNKTVSCIDIDECAVSDNGGCSHKCVNTEGGYRCECPDPELSLSPDNKTCQAPGVSVQCNSENMTITVPKSLLRGMDREHLRLLDIKCKATETSAYFSLTTQLSGCNTRSRHTPAAIVYSNAVLEIPVTAEDVVTRVREIEIQFSCFYSKNGVVSTVGWKPSNKKLVFKDEGHGNFTLYLNMFADKRFVGPYIRSDFPVAVVLRKLLFFEVSVKSDDKQLSIRADRCYATPTQDRMNPLKYEFIKEGCPNYVTVKYHSAPSVSVQRFSLEAFKFIADHPFVFVHCHVVVCNATDPDSKCAKSCSSGGRRRREVSAHVTDVYSLSQGPLHLERKTREEKHASGLDKTGSSPTGTMMALFLVCVACLAGTALIALKKSRDRPDGYTVLTTDEQK